MDAPRNATVHTGTGESALWARDVRRQATYIQGHSQIWRRIRTRGGCGRVLSGAGAVLLNVLVTKMVTDWFQGRENVLALGILITSWPLGIAIARYARDLTGKPAAPLWFAGAMLIVPSVALRQFRSLQST